MNWETPNSDEWAQHIGEHIGAFEALIMIRIADEFAQYWVKEMNLS